MMSFHYLASRQRDNDMQKVTCTPTSYCFRRRPTNTVLLTHNITTSLVVYASNKNNNYNNIVQTIYFYEKYHSTI